MPLTGIQALQLLAADPRPFLERYVVTAVGANNPSGLETFKIANSTGMGANTPYRPGSRLGSLNKHATEKFRIWPAAGLAAAGDEFQAYNIQMVPSNNPVVMYNVPANAPNLLITGGLSGCSFLVDDLGNGQIACAHMQPSSGAGTGNENGPALAARLSGQYGVVYGRNRYHAQNQVCVVGVRRGGQWKIYAQKLDYLGLTIQSVDRIFP
jgi:hypothetical protein